MARLPRLKRGKLGKILCAAQVRNGRWRSSGGVVSRCWTRPSHPIDEVTVAAVRSSARTMVLHFGVALPEPGSVKREARHQADDGGIEQTQSTLLQFVATHHRAICCFTNVSIE